MQSPLLLLHGALGSAAQFDDLRRHLPAELPVYALDFPGHGGLPTDEAFSIPGFADSIVALLDQYQIPSVQIFGYSMGGYVALYLAWKYPARVARISTLGTKFDWTPETAARETARLDPEKIAAKVPAFAELLAQRHIPADWQVVLHRTADLLRGLGDAPVLTPAVLQAITCPVRIGLGADDNMVTPEESRAAAGLLPQGRFEVLPDTRHPFEQVDMRRVAEWILIE